MKKYRVCVTETIKLEKEVIVEVQDGEDIDFMLDNVEPISESFEDVKEKKGVRNSYV